MEKDKFICILCNHDLVITVMDEKETKKGNGLVCYSCARKKYKKELIEEINKEKGITLKEWQIECHKIAVEKGWHDKGQERSFGDYCALFHSEISEAFEEYRKGHKLNTIYYGNDDKPEGIAIEMADLLIRIFDWAQAEDIDLEHCIKVKIKYNKTRPHRHGGKKV